MNILSLIYTLSFAGIALALIGGTMYGLVFASTFDKTFATRPDKQNRSALALRIGQVALRVALLLFVVAVAIMFMTVGIKR